MKTLIKYALAITFLASMVLSQSCKEEDKETQADKDLFEEITSITDYTFYKGNDAVLESSAESPHNDYFRVKFNSTANAVLTDDGKLPADGTFPNGSIVIKELYDTQDGDLKLYAVMKKSADDNAANGWIWAEYKPDGSTFYSVSEKGGACTSCHSINERDYVRLFEIFP